MQLAALTYGVINQDKTQKPFWLFFITHFMLNDETQNKGALAFWQSSCFCTRRTYFYFIQVSGKCMISLKHIGKLFALKTVLF